MYFVIAAPLFAGNVHDTAADVVEPTALTAGATGVPTTIGGDTAAGPEPTELFATTRNVYVTPFESPVISALTALDPTDFAFPVCAAVPMYGVTTYAVIGAPPFEAGATHVTVACPARGAA